LQYPRQREESLKPDLLICTGDLAEYGWLKEFVDATTFLGALADRLDLKRDRVVIIPGNHDINRKDWLRSFEEFIEGGDSVVAPWYAKWKKYEKAFNDFYQGVPGAAFHPGQPWSLFSVPSLEVVVAASVNQLTSHILSNILSPRLEARRIPVYCQRLIRSSYSRISVWLANRPS
jgi:hypothetical protein